MYFNPKQIGGLSVITLALITKGEQ